MSLVDEVLAPLTYKADHDNAHIKIPDPKVCLGCKDKPCTTVCPAGVYEWNEAQKQLIVSYENCIECGAARVMCPFNNIQWEPPRGGFGVNYKFG